MRAVLLFALTFISCMTFAQKKTYLLLGTYTSGKSTGVYVYDFGADGECTLVSNIKSSNPSFLAVSADEKYVYAVNEDADSTKDGVGGGVTAFSFDKSNGTLTELNKEFSGGKHPCYVAIDKTGKWLFASNYSSGNFSIYPINKDGSIKPLQQLVQHEGSGFNKERQAGPHVHSTFFTNDNKYVLVQDLGLDKIMMYQFNSTTGKVKPATIPSTAIAPGSGPRHLAFDPTYKHVYLMEEMSGRLAVYNYSNGKLSLLQRINALPKDFKGDIGGADIHVSPDGKFVYASNRGSSNTIGIFKVNAATGKLTNVGFQSTLGEGPRNFNFDPTGKFLLVANQRTDNVIIFSINKKTGLLADTGKRIEAGNPVCVKWITK